MTEGSADGQAPLPGVLGRLQARAAQRAADAAKRLEALQSSADPRESVEGFMDAFSRQRQALEASLQALTAGGAAPVSDGSPTVDSLAADIAELDKEVAAAAYYLPTYDLRQATLAVSALKEQLEAAKAALQPRKKFSFSSRRAQGAKAQPAAAGGSGGGGTATAAAATAAPPTEDGSGSSTLQQLLGNAAAPSTSGRTLSGLSNCMVVEARDSIAGLDVTLCDLVDCTILLPAPLAALFVRRLTRCRLYAGPVAGATFIEDVSDSTLMLASRQVRIHTTHRTDIYLRVGSNPIIEHSSGVRFAPYALTYPQSEQDLAEQSLQQETGKWAEVHDFGWLRATQSPNWEVLPESERQQLPAVPQQQGAS